MDEVFALQASFASLLKEVIDESKNDVSVLDASKSDKSKMDKFKEMYEAFTNNWHLKKDEVEEVQPVEPDDELTQIKKRLKQLEETTVKKAEFVDAMDQVPNYSDIVKMLISGKSFVRYEDWSKIIVINKLKFDGSELLFEKTSFVYDSYTKTYSCINKTLDDVLTTHKEDLQDFGAIAEFTEIFNNWQKYNKKVEVNKGTAKEIKYIDLVEKYYNLGFNLVWNAFQSSIHKSIFNTARHDNIYKKNYETYKKLTLNT